MKRSHQYAYLFDASLFGYGGSAGVFWNEDFPMPVTLSFPGVYIEEIPSGVRAITGVATSVAAFLGFFKRGRMNTAAQIFSVADFEREFGGLDKRSGARARAATTR
jgi:hypothetical protein